MYVYKIQCLENGIHMQVPSSCPQGIHLKKKTSLSVPVNVIAACNSSKQYIRGFFSKRIHFLPVFSQSSLLFNTAISVCTGTHIVSHTILSNNASIYVL